VAAGRVTWDDGLIGPIGDVVRVEPR
jgi:hypothetical protein